MFMASPKNYDKVKPMVNSEHTWEHRSKDIKVGVSRENNLGYAFEVFSGYDRVVDGGYYDSKEEARSVAVEWMRNHPDGIDMEGR